MEIVKQLDWKKSTRLQERTGVKGKTNEGSEWSCWSKLVHFCPPEISQICWYLHGDHTWEDPCERDWTQNGDALFKEDSQNQILYKTKNNIPALRSQLVLADCRQPVVENSTCGCPGAPDGLVLPHTLCERIWKLKWKDCLTLEGQCQNLPVPLHNLNMKICLLQASFWSVVRSSSLSIQTHHFIIVKFSRLTSKIACDFVSFLDTRKLNHNGEELC